MIRLYRAMVEQLLMAAMYLSERGVRVDDVAAAAIRSFKNKGDMTPIMSTYNNGLLYHEWNTTINQLKEILSSPPNQLNSGDSSLVDTIVRILQLPHGRNILSGKAFNSLKKALLMPDELGKLLDIKRLEASCVDCGHGFEDGEMATVHYDGDYVFKCVGCRVPALVRCSVCGNGVAPLSDKIRNMLARGNCGCKLKKGVEAAAAPAEEIYTPEAPQVLQGPGGPLPQATTRPPDGMTRPAFTARTLTEAFREPEDQTRGLNQVGPPPPVETFQLPRWRGDQEAFERLTRRRPGNR